MNIKSELRAHSPAILLGAGIVGFVTAVVMSARATPKAMDTLIAIRDDEMNGYPPASRLEKARAVVPYYLPTAGMILLSTGLILSSDRIIRKRYTSLLGLYAITSRALEEWEAATREAVSGRKADEISSHVLAPTTDPPTTGDVEDLLDGRSAFFDRFSGRYFTAPSVDTVERVISDINLRLVKEDFVPLNDFYFELGMDPIQIGDDIGWCGCIFCCFQDPESAARLVRRRSLKRRLCNGFFRLR